MKDRLSKLSVLVVRYKYDLRADNDLLELAQDDSMLKTWSSIPGLGVKFALANPDANEYGGVYLFEDSAALEAFLASPLLTEWGAHPDVSELTYNRYQVFPEFTLKTMKPDYIHGDFIKDLAPAASNTAAL